VLDECDREMQRLRVKACEQCGEGFDAKRRDARYCSASCRKASNRANVTDKWPFANISPTSREENVDTQILDRLQAQGQTLYRIESTLAAIAEALPGFAERVPASSFTAAIEALVFQLDEEAA
jgi:hypothetical protein